MHRLDDCPGYELGSSAGGVCLLGKGAVVMIGWTSRKGSVVDCRHLPRGGSIIRVPGPCDEDLDDPENRNAHTSVGKLVVNGEKDDLGK